MDGVDKRTKKRGINCLQQDSKCFVKSNKSFDCCCPFCDDMKLRANQKMENCLLLWFEDEIIGLFTARKKLKHCCVITLACSTKKTNASLTSVVGGVKSGKMVEEEEKKERQGGSKQLSQHLFEELTELIGTAGLIVRSTVHVSGRIAFPATF